MTSDTIIAPWDAETVVKLNNFQSSSGMHPFTCYDGHVLRATEQGWICPHDDYTQNWAHEFMTKVPGFNAPPKWTWTDLFGIDPDFVDMRDEAMWKRELLAVLDQAVANAATNSQDFRRGVTYTIGMVREWIEEK